MPSHVDTGSKSDKAAAAQGRKFMGRIYNTVEQKQAAQRAKASFSKTPPKPGKKAGGPSKAVVGAPAGGWGPSEVIEKEVEFTLDDGMIDRTVKLKLFHASFGFEVEGVSDAAEVQVLGVRVRVTYPPGVPYARFALACVTNDAAAQKPLEDVAAVSGSVVSSKNDHLAAFFNVPLVGVPTIRLAAGNEEPSTTLYLRFVAGGDEDHPSASFRFYVTCRKAKVGTASHVL